jgi:predicted DNA-binding transcriptional regulator AlpA
MTTHAPAKLLTNKETAERIGIVPNTLEIWRCKGMGPKYIKLNMHSLRSPIRYRESDITEWLEARICTNTSQYPSHQLATA